MLCGLNLDDVCVGVCIYVVVLVVLILIDGSEEVDGEF